jgi:uncharacterized membrane protein
MMNTQRMAGIALLVIGLALVVVGMNASDSLADQWSNFFTGRFTDTTVWYIVGGIAAAVVGLILTLYGPRRSSG